MKKNSLDYLLFIDASVDPRSGKGVGAYLLLPSVYLEKYKSEISTSEISGMIRVKNFEEVSSTKLEIMTALWSINEYEKTNGEAAAGSLTVITDSQCVAGLPGRREKLEKNNYITKSKNLPHQNADLYRRFFEFHDRIKFEIIKIEGHSPSGTHCSMKRIFSIVDKTVRSYLREYIQEKK